MNSRHSKQWTMRGRYCKTLCLLIYIFLVTLWIVLWSFSCFYPHRWVRLLTRKYTRKQTVADNPLNSSKACYEDICRPQTSRLLVCQMYKKTAAKHSGDFSLRLNMNTINSLFYVEPIHIWSPILFFNSEQCWQATFL